MLPSDEAEEAFWAAIEADPKDESLWLIFADWLEERNDPRTLLLRERYYRPYLKADRRDPVQMILGILDGEPVYPRPYLEKSLCEVAAMVGAPLVPGLLERCRARKSRNFEASRLLAALPADCLLPILPDLIDLFPRHAERLAPALARLGADAVAAVPALLEAERTRAIDRETYARTIARIGPAAGSSAISRLVDIVCERARGDSYEAISKAFVVVALPCLDSIMRSILERAPTNFNFLARELGSKKNPATTVFREMLHSADDYARWGAACVLARGSAGEALPHLLDALRRAPASLLEPVTRALGRLEREAAEAVPLLRELLGRSELPFAESVADALLNTSGDKAEEVVQRLHDSNPLIRQRIILGVRYDIIRDDRVRMAVIHALLDPDPDVRRAAGSYCYQCNFLTSWDEAALGQLRQALRDPDAQVRVGAANAIRHLSEKAVPAEPDLLALLQQDPDDAVRYMAASCLTSMEYESQTIFAGLVAGLDDPYLEVQRICARGLCGWDSMTADRVRLVMGRLGHPDYRVADFLAYAVCRSQEALPEVVAFLHDKLRNKHDRCLGASAALCLGRLKVDDPAVLGDLFAFLDSGEKSGAKALCLVGSAALPGLIDRLRKGSSKMRKQLLDRIGELQLKNPHLKDLLPSVLRCLKHKKDSVRKAALKVLKHCGLRSAKDARLVETMIRQDRVKGIRRYAISVLARISPRPRAMAAIFAEVQKDPAVGVRAAVPDALYDAELPLNVELELLRVALHDRAENVHFAATWRAESLGPAAVPLLPDLLHILERLPPSDWRRQCVIKAMERMGAVAVPILEALRAKDHADKQ